jgi:hypothetical protein
MVQCDDILLRGIDGGVKDRAKADTGCLRRDAGDGLGCRTALLSVLQGSGVKRVDGSSAEARVGRMHATLGASGRVCGVCKCCWPRQLYRNVSAVADGDGVRAVITPLYILGPCRRYRFRPVSSGVRCRGGRKRLMTSPRRLLWWQNEHR